MNSKIWIKKALSTCLMVVTIATYSMVALAGSDKVAGELLVTGKNINGETSFVKVNGELAQSGRSIFSSSTIATPENTNAVINFGKLGKLELAPNTTFALSFDEKGISGDLLAGRVTVLSAADGVNVTTLGGKTLQLKAGESAVATNNKAQDDDDDDTTSGGNGGSYLVYALILGGAAAGIIIAATTNNNDIQLGGGGTVISPTR